MAVPTVATRTLFPATVEAGSAAWRYSCGGSRQPPVCDGIHRTL